MIKFEVVKIDTHDDSANGRVEFRVHVEVAPELNVPSEYTVNFRPTIQYQMSNKEMPKDFIRAHLESQIRNTLEKIGVHEEIQICNL